MAIERTLSIIKPDGVERNLIGEIFRRFEETGLKIIATRMTQLALADAQGFYAEHAERPFFGELVEYMTSGPVVISVLEGEDAVLAHRKLMGATDPAEADPGTIRRDFAKSKGVNTAHGSDSTASAEREISWFFRGHEICGR